MQYRRLLLWGLAAVAGVLVIVAWPHVAHAAPAASCKGAFEQYEDRGWAWMYLGSFGFGFLTSLTPCVYPMIPITLAIFGARGGNVTKRRALALATVYVVGMGITYAALGVAIAVLGKTSSFGSQLNSPFLVVPLAILFLALATSLFGAFTLQLPSSIQLKLNQVGGKGFGGAFAMGLVGGLIAAPCTGPFLIGLLTFVATGKNVVAGGTLLFVYALGMGVLFWALAAFASALPKSGAWMEAMKSIGGMLLLFAGIYYLLPLFPSVKTLVPPDYWFVGVGIGAIVLGVALGAVQRSFHGSGKEIAMKLGGVALVVAGGAALWLWHLAPKQHLPWIHDEQAAFAKARSEGKGVMVDFSATWCNPCQQMEVLFGDDVVYAAITESFVPLKMDVSANSDADDAAKARYDSPTLPSVAFRTASNTKLDRVDHEVEVDEMLKVVRSSANALRTGTLTAKCD
jgi:thiol:disulfide interchange protein DsbD